MNRQLKHLRNICGLMASLMALIAAGSALAAADGASHSASARIQPYLIANRQKAIALARSAAPSAISAHATVLILRPHGYVTAVKGNNGFVCLTERSWSNAPRVKNAFFWNPKLRSPFCYNAAGAHSVLPRYLRRTEWVLAGASQREIAERERAEWTRGRLQMPAPGAMCYMMSKRGQWIGNHPGPWRPHLMFYFSGATAPRWGANLPATPVFRTESMHTAILIVLVPIWSNGSPAPSFR